MEKENSRTRAVRRTGATGTTEATVAPRKSTKKSVTPLPVQAKRIRPADPSGKDADRTTAKTGNKTANKKADIDAPRPYHHGNLREDLVRCGKEELGEVGLADLSLRRIAGKVGVSQVAPKHHFGNKEGLLAAIAASGFRDLTEFRFSRLRPNMSAEQRLRTLLSSYVAFATLHPTLFHLMFAPQFRSPQTHAELNEAASHSYHTVATAAAQYLAAQGKTDEAKAHEVARIAWMCMHGVATLIIENRINPFGAPKVSREQLTNQTLDLIFAGIRGSLGL